MPIRVRATSLRAPDDHRKILENLMKDALTLHNKNCDDRLSFAGCVDDCSSDTA